MCIMYTIYVCIYICIQSGGHAACCSARAFYQHACILGMVLSRMNRRPTLCTGCTVIHPSTGYTVFI